jgi:hypothetical protein
MNFSRLSFRAASICAPNHDVDYAATNVSPTSAEVPPLPARQPTPPLCSMGKLAHVFDQQSLQTAVVAFPKLACPRPLTAPRDNSMKASATLPEQHPQLTPSASRLHFATVRMKRQAYVRMRNSLSHTRDLSTLVGRMDRAKEMSTLVTRMDRAKEMSTLVTRMVKAEDQCNAYEYKPQTLPLTAPSHERSGIERTTANSKAQHCRASNQLTSSTRVLKRMRMQKRLYTPKQL